MGALQKLADRSPAGLAVVDGPLVHVHADEPIRQGPVEVPPEAHGVRQSLLAVRQAVLNAGLSTPSISWMADVRGCGECNCPQRKRQPGGTSPPNARSTTRCSSCRP